MALIDHTYFEAEIFIPGRENQDILEKLQEFIETNEPVLLRELLGYELWKAFNEGLQEETPLQKWIDLRDGAEFTAFNGYKTMWMGLTGKYGLPGFSGAQPQVTTQVPYQYKVGRGLSEGTPGDGDYWADPETGDTELIDERINGASKAELRVHEAGYGDKLNSEYDLLEGGGISLTGGKTFNLNTAWFIYHQKVVQAESPEPGDTYDSSIIANYMYCRWMKKEHTQSVRLGEVKPKMENADQYNAGAKIVSAWNKMSEWIMVMAEFLEVNRATYPEWNRHNKGAMKRKFHPINQFGI